MEPAIRKKIPDVVELARWLIRRDTTQAARNERAVIEEIAELFEAYGFSCSVLGYDPLDASRVNLLARLNPGAGKAALCLGGHVDVVPFGSASWAEDPLAAVVKDGKLYGRGAADMKGGLAAVICAALSAAERLPAVPLEVHIYGGEEQGLQGSRYLAENRPGELAGIGAAVIAEPSDNRIQSGHKGVCWLRLESFGVTAHSSMPGKGVSALAKLLPGACGLSGYTPGASHPYLGASTAVLTTMHSGLNTNSVPDYAMLTLDVRTVAGQDSPLVMEEVKALAGPDVTVSVGQEIPPLWTEPDLPWCRAAAKIVSSVTGRAGGVETAAFSTDGAALRMALPDIPILVLGPGGPGLAHRTDEFVSLKDLHDAREIYERLITHWEKA